MKLMAVRAKHWMGTAVLVLLLTIGLGGCVNLPSGGDLSGKAPSPFPRQSGAQLAGRDIASGRIRLMEAGTRGVFAPEVPLGDPRFAKVPRHSLPSGCTNPEAPAWTRFAEGYNATMVDWILRHPHR